MVIYNPKEWWRLIFAFHRSDTFRTLMPGIIGLAFYTGIICYLENDYFSVSFKNTTVVHSLIGFVLSLLLVFRTNTAYDRWWEGRKAWGSFVNNSRNLILKISALSMEHDDKVILRDLIKNYIYATKEHLRDGVDIHQLIETGPYTIEYYKNANHIPNRVMKAVFIEINKHYSNGVIDGYTLMSINTELQSFTDVVGICERIRKTPIPYSYNIFLKKVIFIYIFSMPIGFVREFGYWSMVIVPAVFYIFAGLEVLAEEIEDPFGTDDNDLPTDQMSATIASNLDEIINDQA
jgi:ion channel-forming bestrophin family protein